MEKQKTKKQTNNFQEQITRQLQEYDSRQIS